MAKSKQDARYMTDKEIDSVKKMSLPDNLKTKIVSKNSITVNTEKNQFVERAQKEGTGKYKVDIAIGDDTKRLRTTYKTPPEAILDGLEKQKAAEQETEKTPKKETADTITYELYKSKYEIGTINKKGNKSYFIRYKNSKRIGSKNYTKKSDAIKALDMHDDNKAKPAAKSAWTGSKKQAIKTAKPTNKAKATGKAFTAAKPKPAAKPTKQPKPKPAAKPKAKSEPKPEVIEKRLEGKIETRKRRARVAITEAHDLSLELEKLQRRKKIVNI